MKNDPISRKQALRRIGGLVAGTGLLPLVPFSAGAERDSDPRPAPRRASRKGRPHIILVMTDQHRGDAIGCDGNPAVLTPHIDALAGEGTHFRHAYSPSPSCTPARSCLLTGLTPWHTGLLGYGRVARRYRYELPRMLRQAGYYTFAVGKNHWFPQKALHGFHGTLVDESGRVEQDGFVSDYRDWFKLQAPGVDPDKTGLGWNSYEARAYALDERLHPTRWIGKTAVDFLDRYDLDAPLFLKVSFERPHSPYDPPQRYLDRYRDVTIPGPVTGDWEGVLYNHGKGVPADSIPTTGPQDASFGNFGIDQVLKSKKHYYANISFIDDQVGELVAKLKEKGMYDNTLILFTADHGDAMGDHYRWRKTYPYQGSVRIPCVVKWPGSTPMALKPGTSLGQPVGLQDILPTFLEAAGEKIPADMDGKSLRSLVTGTGDAWRPYIGIEHATTYWPNNYWAAVTDGHYKYVWYFRTGQRQFFDLEQDPGEKVDLAQTPGHASLMLQWENHLKDYLAERGDGFVKDGRVVKRTKTLLYGPHYPRFAEDTAAALRDWQRQEKAGYFLTTVSGNVPQP